MCVHLLIFLQCENGTGGDEGKENWMRGGFFVRYMNLEEFYPHNSYSWVCDVTKVGVPEIETVQNRPYNSTHNVSDEPTPMVIVYRSEAGECVRTLPDEMPWF